MTTHIETAQHNPDECPLCSGSGEVTIIPFGAADDKADSYGCPACIGADRDKAEQQRDKLLAALERAERKLSAYVGVCTGDKELTETVLPMVRAAMAAERGVA